MTVDTRHPLDATRETADGAPTYKPGEGPVFRDGMLRAATGGEWYDKVQRLEDAERNARRAGLDTAVLRSPRETRARAELIDYATRHLGAIMADIAVAATQSPSGRRPQVIGGVFGRHR